MISDILLKMKIMMAIDLARATGLREVGIKQLRNLNEGKSDCPVGNYVFSRGAGS